MKIQTIRNNYVIIRKIKYEHFLNYWQFRKVESKQDFSGMVELWTHSLQCHSSQIHSDPEW